MSSGCGIKYSTRNLPSENADGLWLMVCNMINDKLHYEQICVPFGCMLILSDDAVHGGCLGNCGSFRFHFDLKQLDKRAQEKLHHDDEARIK